MRKQRTALPTGAGQGKTETGNKPTPTRAVRSLKSATKKPIEQVNEGKLSSRLLKARVTELERDLEARRAEVTEKEQALETLIAKASEHQIMQFVSARSVATLIAEAAEKEQSAQAFRTQVAQMERTMLGVSALNAERQNQIELLQTKLADRDRAVETLKAQLAQEKSATHAISARLAAKQSRIEEIVNLLQQLTRPEVEESTPRKVNGISRTFELSKQARYKQEVLRIKKIVGAFLPHDARVAVVSKGDEELLKLNGRQAWHFPQLPGGVYAGHYPTDSRAAIEHLETLRVSGADYLLFPESAFWWLEYYVEFLQHLNDQYRRVWNDENCIIYKLAPELEATDKPAWSAKNPTNAPAKVLHPEDETDEGSPALKAQKEGNVPAGGLPAKINTQVTVGEFIHTTLSESHSEALFDAEWCLREHVWLYSNFHTRETALFDAEWYLLQNPDVADAKVDPVVHFLRFGANEGRAPHPLFDPKFYLKTYPEAAITGANALKHYLTEGWKKGYKPNPKFDPSFYLKTSPDLAEAGAEPLTHFVKDGLREGRAGCQEDVYFEPFAFEAEFEIPREPTPGTSAVESDIKAVAFYLPQFHPIPENDEWWGKGFTEWTNVRRGEPQFKDHYQPHVPSDLGYYDLRETEVLEKQFALAQQNGIYGFCFYYYWFAGKVLLDLPIRRMLERGLPDFPFCICWANENWTRRWDGQENDILIGQQHSPEDDLAFLKNIEPILLHKGYIRVDGKPLLIVYHPSFLPDAQATAARWREAFRARGHGEIFLAATQTFAYRKSPHEFGFDAVIQFPPHTNCAPNLGIARGLDKSFSGQIYDYNETKWSFIDELYRLGPSRRIYPGVMPSWDNTARRQKKAGIWVNSSPESYYDWLWQVTSFLRKTRPDDEKLVFINAWNEWSEGCHLEPDQNFGYAWLNATRLALQFEGARHGLMIPVADRKAAASVFL